MITDPADDLPDNISLRRAQLRALLRPLLENTSESELEELLDDMTVAMLRDFYRTSTEEPRLDPSAHTTNPKPIDVA